MKNTIKRAVIYARFSSDNQDELSIEAQEIACRKYAEDNNFLLVGVYADKAKTGTDAHRPDFRRMLDDAKKNIFDIVLVHKYDRFARNEIDHGVAEEKLAQYNVKLISIKEPIADSPVGTLMKGIIKSLNQYYSDNLSEEVVKTMRLKATKGLHLGGKPPLGYDVVDINGDKKYAINEKESKAVYLIFKMHADGFGYTEIIDALNAGGYVTKNGMSFKKNSISEVLRNEKYTGIYIYNRRAKAKRVDGKKVKTNREVKSEDEIIRIEGGMPQIIPKELWDTVQTRLAKNKHTGGKFKTVQNYLLSGKLVCVYCGKAMQGSARTAGRNKELYLSYRCPTRGCECKEINKKYLEKFVLESLLQTIFTKQNAEIITSEYNQTLKASKSDSDIHKTELSKEIKKIDSQVGNLLDFIMSGKSSPSIQEKLEELEKRKNLLLYKLRELEEICKQEEKNNNVLVMDFKLLHDKARDLLDDLESIEIKQLFSVFIESILVDNEQVEIQYNLTDAVGEEMAYVIKEKTRPNMDVCADGGDGGSRTPVQKQFTITFSERSR